MMMRTDGITWAGPGCAPLVLLILAACGQPGTPVKPRADAISAPPETAAAAHEPQADASARPSSGEPEGAAALAAILGTARGRPLPEGLAPAGDCPAADSSTASLEELADARVPLKPGLTLTEMWIPTPQEEYECLLQVTAVHEAGVDASFSCDKPDAPRDLKRRLCLSDLESARMLVTQTGSVKVIGASGEDLPETMVGATWFSLSRREFAELKRTGTVRHHYLQPQGGAAGALEVESTAQLHREGVETARLAINDAMIEVPVIRISGEASHWRWGRSEKGRITALVLDDDRFPLLVDYAQRVEGEEQPVFHLSFAKVSFPGKQGDRGGAAQRGTGDSGGMEHRLAQQRRVDVYGIYFAFNSDRIREESAPILAEIVDVLRRNPQWKLAIHGHTDNTGGRAYNLELSRRRSAAVRAALVQRGVAADRLSTAGLGDGAPKDTNETPEGRAHNRRVELIRQ